jgi:hypothetical protein
LSDTVVYNGDNPYKYCNLQWEIIHTLLSCDNIFFVHVFSLVLFCLLMIVQCLNFKSIKLLLLSLSIWNRHGHECSRIWKLSGNFTLIQCIKKCRDFWAEIYWGRLFFRAESNLIQSSCRYFIRVIVPYEISKVNFRVETKILVSMSEEI